MHRISKLNLHAISSYRSPHRSRSPQITCLLKMILNRKSLLITALCLISLPGVALYFLFPTQSRLLVLANATEKMSDFSKYCQRLSDANRLQLALSATDWGKRRTAAESINDPKLIEIVISKSEDFDIRWSLTYRTRNIQLLKKVAKSDTDAGVQLAAKEMLECIKDDRPTPTPPRMSWQSIDRSGGSNTRK